MEIPQPAQIRITKANGETDVFSVEKLYESLRRSGADRDIAQRVVREVTDTIYDGISSNKIYRTAFKLLKKYSRRSAPRYSLKRAIMEMGPTGYPFEHLIGGILQRFGYETLVGLTRQGKCVRHEVDVLAWRQGEAVSVECKYHNRQGYVCDVKVPLYIQSRFLDLQAKSREEGFGPELTQGWVVTNTRFSSDAMDFGKCMNMRLISWDYPDGGSLKELIEQAGLYPVTVLTTLTKAEKTKLLDQKVVVCAELFAHREKLSEMHIPPKRIEEILDEAGDLCGNIA